MTLLIWEGIALTTILPFAFDGTTSYFMLYGVGFLVATLATWLYQRFKFGHSTRRDDRLRSSGDLSEIEEAKEEEAKKIGPWSISGGRMFGLDDDILLGRAPSITPFVIVFGYAILGVVVYLSWWRLWGLEYVSCGGLELTTEGLRCNNTKIGGYYKGHLVEQKQYYGKVLMGFSYPDELAVAAVTAQAVVIYVGALSAFKQLRPAQRIQTKKGRIKQQTK